MNALAELSARVEIQEVAARYADGCDHRDWEAVGALFTDDGVFDARAVYGQEVKGRAALAAFLGGLPAAAAHHPTSLYTTFTGPDRAVTRMKMLVFFRSATFSVDYQWDMADTHEGWRIAHQSIEVVGKVPVSEG
jgi:ketosteroid isomerase-like protein